MRSLRLAAVAVVAALFLVVGSGTAASAAKTITLSGSVACEHGGKVTGIWLQSSGGGSRFVDFSLRSGASWLANYKVTFTISGTSTAAELHVGCGGDGAKWGSNNRIKIGTVSATRAFSAICNDRAGKTAYSCRKWPSKTVMVGMPFTGIFDTALSPVPQHETVGRDVATDFYALDTQVKVYVFAPRDVSLTLTSEYYQTGVCGYVNIGVKWNGEKVGEILYGHLKNYTSGVTSKSNLANGTVLGVTTKWPKASCWQVSTNAGVHTHIAFRNMGTTYSCMGLKEYSTKSRKVGTWIGLVGLSGGTTAKAYCTA